MVTELQKTSLYEQDFLLWSEETKLFCLDDLGILQTH